MPGALTLTNGFINTGTLAVQGDISQAATFDGGTGILLIDGAADQTFTGAATTTTGALPAVVIDKPSGTLTLAGTLRTARDWTYTAGTLDAGSSTLVFAGGTAITGSHTLNAVEVNGGTASIASGDTLSVPGALTLTNGFINTGTLAVQGDISQAATFDGGTGTLLIDGAGDQTFTGSATTTAGQLPNLVIDKPSGTLTLAGTLRTARDWTYTAGTLDAGSSTLVFAGNLAIDAAGMTFADVEVRAGTASLISGMTVGGTLDIVAGRLNALGHPIVIGGDLMVSGRLTAPAALLTVAGDVTVNGTLDAGADLTMNGSVGQSIGGTAAISFRDLAVDNLAGVTLGAPLTATGSLTLNGPLILNGQTLTISAPILGTTSNLVADPAASIAINGTAAGIVLPASVSSLTDLTLNNPSGMALSGPLAVTGTLSLTDGVLDAGSYVLSIGPGGVVVRTSGHVAGSLAMPVDPGSNVTLTFDVGDATTYAPITLTFDMVTSGGTMTAFTVSGEHPAIGTSVLDSTHDANRWWSLVNDSIVFGSADVTLGFVAGDLDVGARPGRFIVGKWDAGWSLPTVTGTTSTTVTGSGITSFSTFAAGEAAADLSVTLTASASSIILGDSVAVRATVLNGGPVTATDVVLSIDLPAGGTAGSIAPSQGSCSMALQTITCVLGAIAPSTTATVDFVLTPASVGAVSVTASVLAYQADPSIANNGTALGLTVEASTPTTTPTPTPSSEGLPDTATGGLLAVDWSITASLLVILVTCAHASISGRRRRT